MPLFHKLRDEFIYVHSYHLYNRLPLWGFLRAEPDRRKLSQRKTWLIQQIRQNVLGRGQRNVCNHLREPFLRNASSHCPSLSTVFTENTELPQRSVLIVFFIPVLQILGGQVLATLPDLPQVTELRNVALMSRQRFFPAFCPQILLYIVHYTILICLFYPPRG